MAFVALSPSLAESRDLSRLSPIVLAPLLDWIPVVSQSGLVPWKGKISNLLQSKPHQLATVFRRALSTQGLRDPTCQGMRSSRPFKVVRRLSIILTLKRTITQVMKRRMIGIANGKLFKFIPLRSCLRNLVTLGAGRTNHLATPI